jgi:hypothetical protein
MLDSCQESAIYADPIPHLAGRFVTCRDILSVMQLTGLQPEQRMLRLTMITPIFALCLRYINVNKIFVRGLHEHFSDTEHYKRFLRARNVTDVLQVIQLIEFKIRWVYT